MTPQTDPGAGALGRARRPYDPTTEDGMQRTAALLTALLAAAAVPAHADDATLRGSPKSMVRQHDVAQENDFTFLRTGGQVRDFVEQGVLVKVEGDANYSVARGVSFPYARPEVGTF